MKSPINVCEDHESLSRQAAGRIADALGRKPDLLLCAAGGTTPLRTYELLAGHHKHAADAFRSLRVVKLDEWGGLGMDDPGSCENQLRTNLVQPLGLSGDRYFGFDSNPADPDAECERIRSRLSSEGPIDLCVLGLGVNGHVAMNEPAPALRPFSHVARLADSSLCHPMLANSRIPPRYGLTLGMAEILASHEILLLVSGANKIGALARLLGSEITTEFPVSFLWLHPRWTLLCDRAAAAGLDLNS